MDDICDGAKCWRMRERRMPQICPRYVPKSSRSLRSPMLFQFPHVLLLFMDDSFNREILSSGCCKNSLGSSL
ncbi:hypothetical protein K458DRAFT_87216 [Lentithecium fluviatile CBS 122367]|uniref:Uncharacterized protein n=1 Tax=Lentithecium fluviatile CBS 122367 TaxID=1168545 RepID=A0A6G1IR66_9PLEO|nr:hypothetical protein K458DRAFT_87216 [Lentithecium fluviatile CBS 122367]